MSSDIESFRQVLRAFVQDPLRADQLVDQVVKLSSEGCEAQRRAMDAELERAIIAASQQTCSLGGNRPEKQRIDAIILTPGGVQILGRMRGKEYLSGILGCKIDEGHRPAILDQAPFAAAFARVRDGLAPAEWFAFEHGQAGFAAAHAELSGPVLERPDRIFAIFITDGQSTSARADPEPKVAPFELAHLIQKVSPSVAKTHREGLMATPDRRCFRLRNGRRLSTRLYGSPDAPVVIVFGPIHKSTLADAFLANAAIACGLALLVIERPGLGASDPAPETCYQAVADDIVEVVTALDLRNVRIYGAGMASSYALAAAHKLGDRACAVALNSPRIGAPSREAPGRYGKVLWAMLWNISGLDVFAKLLWQMRMLGSAQSILATLGVTNERDRILINSDGVLAYWAAQTNDAFRTSISGGLAEFKLYQSGAKFESALVQQPIRAWQGAEDDTLHLDDTQRALAGARHAEITLWPGAGILMTQDEAMDIMRWLANGWRAQSPAASDGRLNNGL
jgi:pimeloyl-ACP methyl ester carboxylesterase